PCRSPAAALPQTPAGGVAADPWTPVRGGSSPSSQSGTCRLRATRSRSGLRGSWSRPQRPGSRILERDRARAAPRAPSGGWRRDRSSDVPPGPEIPEVDPMAILVRKQVLRHDPVLVLRRQPPLARHHVVARQVPPEVIVRHRSLLIWIALLMPATSIAP